MGRDLAETLVVMERWASTHPIAGFLVMGFVAGIVATLKLYERAGVKMSTQTFIARLVTKCLMAVFVAALVFFVWRAMDWSQDWGYVAAGVGGVFATEFIEAAFVTGLAFFRKRFGVTQQEAESASSDMGRRGAE